MLPAIFLFAAAIALPPKPQHYVTDRAIAMDPARVATLDAKLAAYDRRTSNQVIVYIDDRLPAGTTIEEMAAEAIRSWGVGQKGKDNGVILFLFMRDRLMRIEVGYGLEGSLTDAKAKGITSMVLKPRLRAGDVDGAVEQGVDAILKTIAGERTVLPAPLETAPLTTTDRISAFGNAFWNAVGAFFHPLRRAGDVVMPWISVAIAAIFILAIPFALIVALIRMLRGEDSGITFSSSGSDSGRSFGGESSGGGGAQSSGGGGFSGGGGGGGGGGATDSW